MGATRTSGQSRAAQKYRRAPGYKPVAEPTAIEQPVRSWPAETLGPVAAEYNATLSNRAAMLDAISYPAEDENVRCTFDPDDYPIR